jgi:flagellum-specific ATP synthase
LRGLLDGHIVLGRELAARGHFPAIDITRSLSRVMETLVERPHRDAARAVRAHIAVHEAKRDLIALGAYVAGTDPALDAALQRIERIEAFLAQGSDEHAALDETIRALRALA